MMTYSTHDVAVIGAGPYGLAATAHLRAAGVETHIFGDPMSFWQRHMPVGMNLRSPWRGSSIGDIHALTLDRFAEICGKQPARPIPLAEFVAYGLWVQQQAA